MNSSDRFCEVWVLDPKEERHQLKVFSQIHFLEEKQIEIMFGEKKKGNDSYFKNGISSDRKKSQFVYVQFQTFLSVNREPLCASDRLMQDEIVPTLKKVTSPKMM